MRIWLTVILVGMLLAGSTLASGTEATARTENKWYIWSPNSETTGVTAWNVRVPIVTFQPTVVCSASGGFGGACFPLTGHETSIDIEVMDSHAEKPVAASLFYFDEEARKYQTGRVICGSGSSSPRSDSYDYDWLIVFVHGPGRAVTEGCFQPLRDVDTSVSCGSPSLWLPPEAGCRTGGIGAGSTGWIRATFHES